MALYFKDTEITNIDNLVPQAGLDITDLWFGSTNVYTVWQTYEGTLPATINANGSDMRQYQVWGNVGGVGDDSGTSYGYEIDISTSDGANTTTTPIYIGNEPLEKVGNYSDYVDYEKQKVIRTIRTYVLTGDENWEQIEGDGGDATKKYFRIVIEPLYTLMGRESRCTVFSRVAVTKTTSNVGYNFYDSSAARGTTLNIRPQNVETTTLSDFKAWLAEQYAAGTPVTVWCALITAEEIDPPVPLPALPTCEGTTVIDYEGQSSVAPEKALLKYRKEGF